MLLTSLAGRSTSRLGLGCGRLVGGAGALSSHKVIQEALALGISHFDVAPSYGLGLAEDVLGEALAGVPHVTIVTKAGIGRPGHAGLKSIARQLLRPVLGATPNLKAKLARQGSSGLRGQFAPEQVSASLADSLKRLKRDHVDGLLLHQPMSVNLTTELIDTMSSILQDGRARAVGSATNDDAGELVRFGSINQYRFDAARPSSTGGKSDLILHGAMRRYRAPASLSRNQAEGMSALGRDPRDPAAWIGLVLTLALASRPTAILLVSSSSPARLRAAVEAVDWVAAETARPEHISLMRQLVTERASLSALPH